MLLPYLEQVQVYNAINFYFTGRGSGTSENIQKTAMTTRINAFLCPSSRPPSQTWYNAPFAGNSYFASAGSTVMWLNQGSCNGSNVNVSYTPNGLFAVGGLPYGFADIIDGSANTVAFGEYRIGDFNDAKLSIQDIVGVQWGSAGFPGVGNRNMVGALSNMPAGGTYLRQALQLCNSSWRSMSGGFGTNGQRSWHGRMWHPGEYGHALGNLLVPPNSQYPYCQFWDTNADWDSAGIDGPTSFHPGGANLCMADGSVHFIKTSIQWYTLWALGSRDQGEVVSANQY